MSLVRVHNIWTVDLSKLSRRDSASVYFERAKVVIARALADPDERARAINGKKFSRRYLTEGIGSGASVAHQNPRIIALLKTIDEQLRLQSSQKQGLS